MSQRELDKAVAAMLEESPDEKVVHQAAGRVFRKLFDSAFLPETVERIRGCADFQALIPAFLNRTLAPARALLVQDHMLKCVDCRRVLRQAQGQDAEPVMKTAARSGKRVPVMAWALAATLLVGIAAGITGARYGLLPGQSSLRATVASVEGDLYRVSDFGSALIKAGDVITNEDEIRSAKGAEAIVKLAGGGEVEIAEQSDISVYRGWRGTTVNVNEGRVIVQGRDSRANKLYLSGGGMLVPVTNSVLAMDRGSKGSRLAVARGLAQVQQGQNRFQLTAGQQVATNGVGNVPIASEFAWSKNADSYLALLSEFSTLQKQFQSIPSPGLRFSSDLAKYVPGNAVLYAAIPNLGGTISEAKRIFDDRLAQSEVLRNWWGQHSGAHAADFDRQIAQISSISQYLGNEIVFSLSSGGSSNDEKPLLLADIAQPGLADYLQQQLPPSAGVQIVETGSALPSSANGRLLVLLTNNVLAASTDPAQLKLAAQRIQNSSLGSFIGTPFYSRIAKSYAAGAEYLLAVDLEQMVKKSVSVSEQQMVAGIDNAQYLVLERRDAGGASDTRGSVSFNGARQGVASWLGAPGPVGSLDFVSPDASFAAAFTMKNPRAVVEALIGSATKNDAKFSQELNEFESKAGLNVLDDVAGPVGNDAAFAFDGPLLPVPSWKLAIEVNDPVRLQQTITTIIARFNEQEADANLTVHTGSEQVSSRTFYWMRSNKAANMTVYYTFIDGYLVAGANEANLTQAIQNRESGYTLASSANFRNQLPADSYTNFSGVLYVNPGNSLGSLAQSLKGNNAQQQSLLTLLANSSPGLVCVYGEPDRIVAASRGFNLLAMLGK